MNHPFDLLQSNLLDLLYELRTSEIRLIVCGGYGLYLKHQWIEKTNASTLLSFIPAARSTNDLDLFLATQVLVDREKAKTVLEAIQALQYMAIENRENYQFSKEFNHDGQLFRVKFDFLTKMPDDPSEVKLLEVQEIRVKNKGRGGIHAHLTIEAIAVEDNPAPMEIVGSRTTGEGYGSRVYVPQAYAYLMMKLFAFRDWEAKKQNPSYARKHALDLYTIVAMMTEEELVTAEAASQRYGHTEAAQEAARIVNEFFSQTTAMGSIRLREHQSFDLNAGADEFMSILMGLFRT